MAQIIDGKYIIELDELTNIELVDWLAFQPNAVLNQAYRISLTNFIKALPIIPAVAGEYADIDEMLAAQGGQTVDVFYKVADPSDDPDYNDLKDSEIKSVYYHLVDAKTGSLSNYNSIAIPKIESSKFPKLGNSLEALTFDVKFRSAKWSSNKATLQAIANALKLSSPQDLLLDALSLKLNTDNNPTDISRVLFGLDGQLIFEPIDSSKIQSDSDSGDVTLDDDYALLLTIIGNQDVANGIANIGLTAKSFSTGAITAFQASGNNRVRTTSAAHGFSEGDYIEIVNTSNYDGVYEIKAVPNINDFDFTATFVSTETGDWEKSEDREIAVDLRVDAISVKEFTRQIEGEGRLNFSEQVTGLLDAEDIDVYVKSNTAGESIEILGTVQDSQLKVVSSDASGGGSALETTYDSSSEVGGNVANDKTNVQTALKESRDWINEPAQQLTAFTETNIIIDGTKTYSEVRAITASTLTITANSTLSNHLVNNYLSVRYSFSQDCTLTLENFDSIGNKTGDITPIPAGTYDLYFVASAFGVNLLVKNNTGTSVTQLSGPLNFAGSAGDEQVSLSWSSVQSATGYTLEFHDGDLSWAGVPGYDGTSTNYDHTSLSNGTQYFYRVKATAAGYTDSSYSETTATPASGTTQLTAPTLNTANSGNAQVTLNFDNNAGGNEDDTLAQYKLDTEPTIWTNGQIGAAGATSIIQTGLVNDSLYDFRLIHRGSGAYSNSVPSNELSAMPVTAGTWELTIKRSGLFTDCIGLAVDGPNDLMYLIDRGTEGVRKIDMTTWLQVGSTLALTGGNLGGDCTIFGTKLYITDIGAKVWEVDLVTFTQTAAHSITNSQAWGIGSDATNLYIGFLGGGGSGKIEVRTESTMNLDRVISNAAIGEATAVDFKGDFIYTRSSSGSNKDFNKLDITDSDSLSLISEDSSGAGGSWYGMCVDQDRDLALVSIGDALLVRNTLTGALVDTITVTGILCYGGDYYNDKMYFVDANDDTIVELTFS